jgi:2-polyprenyl-3-methyl-5-hydroxy-6-metoxy-1,4-benzoquinol methylase
VKAETERRCPSCTSYRFRQSHDPDFICCEQCGLLCRARLPENLQQTLDDIHIGLDGYKPPLTDTRANNGVAFILKHAPELVNGRVLDIGCGWGHFIAAMNRIGARASGLDASARHVNLTHMRGLDVRLGRCNRATMRHIFGNERFNLISLFSSLIYMDDPGEILDLCREYLMAEGALLICDLQPDSPFYWRRGVGLLERSGRTTTYFFSKETLSYALAQRGFRIVASQKYPVPINHAVKGWRLPPQLWPIYTRVLPPILRLLPADFLSVLARPLP